MCVFPGYWNPWSWCLLTPCRTSWTAGATSSPTVLHIDRRRIVFCHPLSPMWLIRGPRPLQQHLPSLTAVSIDSWLFRGGWTSYLCRMGGMLSNWMQCSFAGSIFRFLFQFFMLFSCMTFQFIWHTSMFVLWDVWMFIVQWMLCLYRIQEDSFATRISGICSCLSVLVFLVCRPPTRRNPTLAWRSASAPFHSLPHHILV